MEIKKTRVTLAVLAVVVVLTTCSDASFPTQKPHDGSFKIPSRPFTSFTNFVVTLSVMVAFLAASGTCAVIWICWKIYTACCKRSSTWEGLPGISNNGHHPEPVVFHNIAYCIDEDCTIVELPSPVYS